ncbi:MAG: putative two-component system sensor histidine kinase, partial [Marmoricola sp.]|nr:putative two-component system sensor histidine kinase [Marmoricola sp.]
MANDPNVISSSDSPLIKRSARLRITLGTGLQGKLVLCFVVLLAATLGVSCWLFITETRAAFDRLAGEQARQLSRTLAMASEPPLERGDARELQRIGAELMRNRGVVAVAFFDAAGKQLAIAALDPDIERVGTSYFASPHDQSLELETPSDGWTASLGRYVELTTPITRISSKSGTSSGPQVLGYVTVCLSQSEVDSHASNVRLLVILIGAVGVLVCVPMMYLLVHRVFTPIRQLVGATERITRGELDTSVAIERPDVIGTLARAFNVMANRVRIQQTELREANQRLEQANANLEGANDKLAFANQDLEEKVRQRTAQFEQANTRLSSEIAEKDDFLRTVSHDLNAPLRNIAGMASTLLSKHRESFNEDVIHRLERIQKNVEVETSLIGELLELSRIKTRRQKMEVVNLVELAHEVGELISQDLDTRRIRLMIDSGLPTLHCERSRLRQLLQNLVDNAIKYMGTGSDPQLLAEAGVAFEPVDAGERVREIEIGFRPMEGIPELFVRDTGIG